MKFCPSCGGELRPGARFCISCGTPLVVEQVQPIVQQPYQQAVPFNPPQPVPEPYPPTYQQQGYQQNGNNQAFPPPNYAGQQSEVGIVTRAMNMILKPKTEWINVYNETPNNSKSLTYAVLLLLIPAISNFLAYGFIGVKMMGYTFKSIPSGVQQGLSSFIGGFLSLYVTAIVINALATSFDSEKNFGRSMQLVVYSMTPFWVAGIFFLIPGFQPFVFLVGIYGLYLLYQGMPVLMRTPQHKTAGYLIVSIIVMIVVQVIIMLILGVILGLFFASRMGGF
jgi:Yip1 domain/zinc-ribbon domain